MNVSLTPELERFVAGRVASGRYQNNSEVIRAALRLLQVQECKDVHGIDGADPQPQPSEAPSSMIPNADPFAS
ncbi:type II toxin-antitoxin system ParD family antitoxin [Microvirga sp. Marseille-Q2068]|uniref:Type II toxin-antitoxin system ParD family antitoxin n=2 Tax=Microvirga mediterraneensis TaxID=2754695 RepID=A0A838BVV2_9HYPH|nr:type II toxin-antitoxin system ParD family antitoxin [Microvirga mediterraneensis]